MYSYGVILYEIATLLMPWDGLDGMQICMQLAMKNKLEMPESANPTLLLVFRECLAEPATRPTFQKIQEIMDAALYAEESSSVPTEFA